MINTLLEHVPIKMEVKDVNETANKPANDEVTTDDEKINETDEEVDDVDDDDEEEESDIESDALEIEQEATMLISSDEEAELEAQRIRFPNVAVTKKLRKDSNNSSRSSSRNSECSNTSSNTHVTYEIVTKKSTTDETDNKQRITLLLKNTEVNKSLEICKAENGKSTQTLLKSKKEKKKTEKTTLENNKNKKDDSDKHLDNNKTPADILKNTEKLIKSPVSEPVQKDRRGSNNSSCSVASTVTSDSAETECCGNIYVFNLQHKLIFNCQFCDLKYGDLDNFGRHLHEAHRLFNLDEGPEKENAPRNLPKTNRITKNAPKSSANVKKEPLQPFELVAEPPVVLPPSVLAEPLDSCGNVFMLNHRKLFLVCGYCECKYANLDLFEKHLRQQHRIFEGCRNELNVIPKVEIKEETYFINEAADKPTAETSPTIVAKPSDVNLSTTIENEAETTVPALAETIVTGLEQTIEAKGKCGNANKEQTSSPSVVAQNDKLESMVNKEVETPTEIKAIPKPNGNKKVEIENKEISSPKELINKDVVSNEEAAAPKEFRNNEISSAKENKNKRFPSTALTTSPPKNPKTNIQNKTKHDIKEQKTATLTEPLADKVEEPAQITETKNITEIVKTKETEATVRPPATDSVEIIIPETTEAIESKNPKEISESDTKVPPKATERRKNRKSTKETQTGNKRRKREEYRKIRTAEKCAESKTPASKEAIAVKPIGNIIKSSQANEVKQEKLEVGASAIESQEISDTESKYKCSMCPKVLAHKNSLKIHERIHTGEKPYECEVCHKHFRNRGNLSHHKKGHHADETSHKIYKCEICEKTFSHSTQLKKHIFSHSLPKRFKCGICLRGYSTKDALKLHIERDHKPGEKLAKSKRRSAGKQVLTSTKIEADTLPQLSTSPPPPCLIESMQETDITKQKNMKDINDLNDLDEDPVNDIIEQLQNEMTNNELQNVELSTVTFTINAVVPEAEETKKSIVTTPTVYETQLNEIDSNVSGQHQLLKVVKRFLCNECHSTFDKRIRLIEHKRVHTGEKPFTCDECGKQFRIRIRLKEHKLRHSKEKKFICEICQLGCCTKQDLNQHMRHHTNDRRYQCTMCPKAFVRSSDLKIHVRVHTGEKPYICDICHKCFRANQNLCVHKKSHMGDASKIYKCEHCEKKFMRNIDRKVHMRSHTGEKPYKCEICERGYSSKFNVRAHIERDHIAAKGTDDTVPKGKRKPGPKPKALKEELEKQKKLIEELRNQLWHQLKRDEKIIPSDEEILPEQSLLEDALAATENSPLSTTSNLNDPIQSAYELLNKLKSSTNISKPLTAIPSPPPLAEPLSNPFTNAKKLSTTLLPLTITQKLEQASPIPTPAPSSSTSCPTTPSPPKTTATKVVSQKTSLGIQQVSVTVSMQVENVTASPASTVEKENAGIMSGSPSGASSPKKERKITSYFTVVGQKAEV